MPSTFFGLNIGTTGLFNYQAALNTTGHNIANVQTKGYSRQQIIQQAGDALSVNNSYGMVGTGVATTGLVQIRDIYYDIKFWNNNTISGEYTTKYHYMTEVENHFNEINQNGFNTIFNDLFNGIQELSKNAESGDTRTSVLNTAETLTEYFNSMSTNLKSIQEETNTEIKNQVDRINSLAEQISIVTKQINLVEVGNQNANDLRDQRALLLDQLSEIASISVSENKVGDESTGVTNFVVKIDGHTLVDSDEYNTLQVVPRDKKLNQNDIDGLYDIKWNSGEDFNVLSHTLGGTLKAVYEVRDGNNEENLRGSGAAAGAGFNNVGDKKLKLTNASIQSINKLNINSEGSVKVGNKIYHYTGFTANKEADGTFTYTFDLKEALENPAANEQVSVGESINYKGIPHYMSKLNEFVRTFAAEYNKIHNAGEDKNGDKGLDFFNGADPVTGNTYTLEENPDTYTSNGAAYTDAAGNSYNGNYYLITAENFTITKELTPDEIVTSSQTSTGDIANNDIALELLALKEKADMFKQGKPASFIQTLFDEVGIDTQKAKDTSDNQGNILHSIENQRLSVSGVDEEEEGMSLIQFKHAYDLSAKVVSVMNEVLNKLINEMGV